MGSIAGSHKLSKENFIRTPMERTVLPRCGPSLFLPAQISWLILLLKDPIFCQSQTLLPSSGSGSIRLLMVYITRMPDNLSYFSSLPSILPASLPNNCCSMVTHPLSSSQQVLSVLLTQGGELASLI